MSGRRSELAGVRRAAARVTASRSALELAVLEARAAGLSLRVIAEAAGLSHEQVRRLELDADGS